MIVVGYIVLGLLTTVMALSGNLGAVLSIAFGIGIANMLFIIPSQTLFQERTPGNLIGRVEVVGVTTVIAAFGLVTAAAGAIGWFVPAVREA